MRYLLALLTSVLWSQPRRRLLFLATRAYILLPTSPSMACPITEYQKRFQYFLHGLQGMRKSIYFIPQSTWTKHWRNMGKARRSPSITYEDQSTWTATNWASSYLANLFITTGFLRPKNTLGPFLTHNLRPNYIHRLPNRLLVR